ncbi:uncharacterized protein LOC130458069 [Monodelphis domestica]|uniref:uncharacterized protein LOC130458069 n=1 Tax=Monodelphis domestica TaxID=13616 RepID=UPI0024E1C0E3|nr:uncharacterized protein LOC130458069 [Monodelphis domestica]
MGDPFRFLEVDYFEKKTHFLSAAALFIFPLWETLFSGGDPPTGEAKPVASCPPTTISAVHKLLQFTLLLSLLLPWPIYHCCLPEGLRAVWKHLLFPARRDKGSQKSHCTLPRSTKLICTVPRSTRSMRPTNPDGIDEILHQDWGLELILGSKEAAVLQCQTQDFPVPDPDFYQVPQFGFLFGSPIPESKGKIRPVNDISFLFQKSSPSSLSLIVWQFSVVLAADWVSA